MHDELMMWLYRAELGLVRVHVCGVNSQQHVPVKHLLIYDL